MSNRQHGRTLGPHQSSDAKLCGTERSSSLVENRSHGTVRITLSGILNRPGVPSTCDVVSGAHSRLLSVFSEPKRFPGKCKQIRTIFIEFSGSWISSKLVELNKYDP